MIHWTALLRTCGTGSLLPVWLAVTTALAQAPPEPARPSGVSEVELQEWVAELGAAKFEVREAAENRLAKAGAAALDVVAAAIESKEAAGDPEVRQRLFRILQRQLQSPTGEQFIARRHLNAFAVSLQSDLVRSAQFAIQTHSREVLQRQEELDAIDAKRRHLALVFS